MDRILIFFEAAASLIVFFLIAVIVFAIGIVVAAFSLYELAAILMRPLLDKLPTQRAGKRITGSIPVEMMPQLDLSDEVEEEPLACEVSASLELRAMN